MKLLHPVVPILIVLLLAAIVGGIIARVVL